MGEFGSDEENGTRNPGQEAYRDLSDTGQPVPEITPATEVAPGAPEREQNLTNGIGARLLEARRKLRSKVYAAGTTATASLISTLALSGSADSPTWLKVTEATVATVMAAASVAFSIDATPNSREVKALKLKLAKEQNHEPDR